LAGEADASKAEATSSTPEKPKTLWGKIDHFVHQLEGGVVAGALLVMALTYVLKIIDRDMRAKTTAFDKFFLSLAGHPIEAEAPPEVVESITGFWSPLILGVSCYLLCVLAFRTRDRFGPLDGEPVTVDAARRRSWWVKALLATGAIFLSLKIVEWVPPKYLCTVAMLVMMIPALRHGVKKKEWGGFTGVLVGGGWLVWFFLTQAGDNYTWNDKLSLVLLMYVGFFGASMATKEGRHIKVDAFRKIVPQKRLHLYNAIGNTVTLLFVVFLLILAYRYNEQIGLANVIEGLNLGYWLITMPIAISLLVMAFRFGGTALFEFRAYARGELPVDTGPELH